MPGGVDQERPDEESGDHEARVLEVVDERVAGRSVVGGRGCARGRKRAPRRRAPAPAGGATTRTAAARRCGRRRSVGRSERRRRAAALGAKRGSAPAPRPRSARAGACARRADSGRRARRAARRAAARGSRARPRTTRRGTSPHDRRVHAAEAAGTPARSTRPRRRRAPARAARPSTATRGRAGSRRTNPTSPVHASHVRGLSPAPTPTATPARDTPGDCPHDVPQRDMCRDCPGVHPKRHAARASSGDSPHELPTARSVPRAEPRRPRPSEPRRGTVPMTCLRETCLGTVPGADRKGHVLPRRVGGLSPDASRFRRSGGEVYGAAPPSPSPGARPRRSQAPASVYEHVPEPESTHRRFTASERYFSDNAQLHQQDLPS